MPDWIDFFRLALDITELIARGTVTYLGLVALLRLVGRREAGGLGLTDLLVVLLAVDAASIGLTGESESLGDSVVLVVTVLFWSIAVDAVAYRWPGIGRLVKARPRPIVEDGRIDRRAMLRELMTEDEVVSQLRLHGIHDLSRVERAYIEPNGMVSILLREPPQEQDAERPPAL